ncbi:MAG: hypothetical protein JXR81_08415 [Candidatus Goldbacteria bacterium]|nr:hypothetical protein [Candidatus Goldiibacteriota bacterium]
MSKKIYRKSLLFHRVVMALFFLFFIVFPFSLYCAWLDVDGTGQESINIFPTDNQAGDPDIAIDGSGNPHVVWFEHTGTNYDIYYIKWNGTGWVDADGAGLESARLTYSSGDSIFPNVAVDSAGRPHIAWQETSGVGGEIFYCKWNGLNWVKADGVPGFDSVSASLTVNSAHPFMVLDSSDKPHIVWNEGAENEYMGGAFADIQYAAWNGTQWADADGTGTESRTIYSSPYYSLYPHLDTDSAGRPHITWCDGEDENREIYYLKWNGASWTDADGAGQESINISNSADYSAWPYIDIDNWDVPHVVWEDFSSGHQDVYYLKFNGASWVDADGTGAGNINITYGYHNSSVPMIKVDASGIPHVMFGYGSLETTQRYCLKYNPAGALWSGEDGTEASVNISSNEINNSWSSFELDPGGYPHVVWPAGYLTDPHDIYYLRWLPEGTPTITPTITITYTAVADATATLTHTVTKTVTRTKTPTITKTLTYTMTPNPQPSATPNSCWADADGTAQESVKVSPGTNSKMALDQPGNPHIVYEDAGEIYYLFWNGTQWTDADGSGTESAMISVHEDKSFDPALYLDSSGRPNIAWNGGLYEGWQQIYFLKYNGFSWVDADGSGVEKITVPAYNGGFPQDVSLALDPLQQPLCVWVDYPAGKTYTVKDVFFLRWNGSSWTDNDGTGYESSMVSFNTYPCIEPDLKIMGGLTPYIAWIMQTPGDNSVIVKRWHINHWIQTDGSTAETDIITNPDVLNPRRVKIVIDADKRAHVVFDALIGGNREICYLKWDGTQWVDFDGAGQESINISNTPGFSQGASIAVDSSGHPHISWFDEGGIYYIRWNGIEFTGADGLPGSKLIAPASGRETGAVSSALKPGDVPAVSWHDDIAGQQDVYYLYHVCAYNTPTFTATITPTVTMTPTVTLTPEFSATNTITVSPTITPAPVELKPVKKAFGENPGIGSEITYEITLENNSDFIIYNPALWDTLPEEINYTARISGPAPDSLYSSGNYYYWSISGTALNPGASITIRFSTRISSIKPDGIIMNTVCADYLDPHHNTEDNRHPPVISEISYFPEGKVLVYPNPFNPATAVGGNMKFINLTPDSRVEIYNLSGEHVISLHSPGVAVFWNGTNRNGQKVSPGIYYYVIINLLSQEKIKGKFFVISK